MYISEKLNKIIKMKTSDLKFEVQSGEHIMDMLGEELCVAVGTDNNDDDISVDDIENDEISKLFDDVCENVFVLTDKGRARFSGSSIHETVKNVTNFLISTGMKHH
jgi:predicted ribosome quality control (RQC) complex YloA/Tae2 family protein